MASLRTRPVACCVVCGGRGRVVLSGVADPFGLVPGAWRTMECLETTCGLLWLDPAPLPEDLGAAYVGYYTHDDGYRTDDDAPWRRAFASWRDAFLHRHYGYPARADGRRGAIAAGLVAWHPVTRAAAEFSVMYLPYRRGGRVLEVGCGGGHLLRRLAESGWQVEGVDTDRVAVDNARAKGLTVHHGSLGELALPAATFDAVVMSHVLEHVVDPVALLAECRRVLRPGGLLRAVTPNAASWGRRWFGRHWRALEAPRHLQVFTPTALRRAALAAGLGCEAVTSSPRGAAGVLVESQRARRGTPNRPGAPVSWRDQLWSRAGQLAEAAAVRLGREVGEELVLRAFVGETGGRPA